MTQTTCWVSFFSLSAIVTSGTDNFLFAYNSQLLPLLNFILSILMSGNVMFTGFNGFGQFGCEKTDRVNAFKSILVDERFPYNSDFLISCSWSYTAYAVGRVVVFRGFVAGKPNNSLSVTTYGDVNQIAACERLCLVLLEDGQLLKIHPKTDVQLQEVSVLRNTPKKRNIFGEVKPVERMKFSFIAVGANITAAVSDTNAVFSVPSQILELPKHFRIKQLVCGFEHALLLTANGDVYSWGNGLRGQLGNEQLQVEEAPVLINALAGIKVLCIAAGGWHSAAISAFGDVYTWGFNSNGQLGLRLFKPSGLKEPSVYPLPQLHDLPDCSLCGQKEHPENRSCTPSKVFAGARHTVLQMSCGSLLVTGWNKHGQLGYKKDEEIEQCDVFKRVCIEESVEKVYCGHWSTIIFVEKLSKNQV